MLFAPLINIIFDNTSNNIGISNIYAKKQQETGVRSQVNIYPNVFIHTLYPLGFTRISTLSMLTLSMLHNATHRCHTMK